MIISPPRQSLQENVGEMARKSMSVPQDGLWMYGDRDGQKQRNSA